MAEIHDRSLQIGVLTEHPAPKRFELPDGTVVYDGVPMAPGGFIYVPNTPHLFHVDELTVSQKDRTPVTIKNIMLMLGDGTVRAGKRAFSDGQIVSRVVQSWKRFAKSRGLPIPDVLVACGGTPAVHASDIDVPRYTVGGKVHLHNELSSPGRLRLTMHTEGAFITPRR